MFPLLNGCFELSKILEWNVVYLGGHVLQTEELDRKLASSRGQHHWGVTGAVAALCQPNILLRIISTWCRCQWQPQDRTTMFLYFFSMTLELSSKKSTEMAWSLVGAQHGFGTFSGFIRCTWKWNGWKYFRPLSICNFYTALFPSVHIQIIQHLWIGVIRLDTFTNKIEVNK